MRPLMSVAELASRLGDESLRICDVRWSLGDPRGGRRDYDAAHVPGAVFVDLETELSGDDGPGRHPLPEPADFTAALGHLGIGPDHHVVAYDHAGGAIAARLWWMLTSIGHRDVSVLDGGIAAWTAAGHPLGDDVPHHPPVDYPPAQAWKGVVGTDQVRAAVGRSPIVDARAPERYRGDFEPIDPRAGHIPSAVNIPYEGNLGDGRATLTPAELRERYAGVATNGTIVYCGSGVTACHDILAMTVAGLPMPRLYAGSWSAWSSDPTLPAEVGDPASPGRR